MLKKLEKRLQEQKIFVEINSNVYNFIALQLSDKSFGARPLRRKIQNMVEDKIDEEILEGRLKKEQSAIIEVSNNEIQVYNK